VEDSEEDTLQRLKDVQAGDGQRTVIRDCQHQVRAEVCFLQPNTRYTSLEMTFHSLQKLEGMHTSVEEEPVCILCSLEFFFSRVGAAGS
jgi:hypothetical protein